MVSGRQFRLDLEALAGSAAQVAGQGDDLALAHLISDNRIVSARSGWVGRSAAALAARADAWLDASRRLLTDVGDHALTLDNDGVQIAALEGAGAAAVRAAHL